LWEPVGPRYNDKHFCDYTLDEIVLEGRIFILDSGSRRGMRTHTVVRTDFQDSGQQILSKKEIDLESDSSEDSGSLYKIKIGGLELKVLQKERNATSAALF
jgi:hypothetical protein